MSLPEFAYGQQFLLDGYGADASLVGSVDILYQFLLHLPEQIGMTRIGFPHIIKIDEPGIKGLSGFVFIMESHISAHTYEERGFITIDVYSCKSFDTSTLEQHMRQTFGIKTCDTKTLIRGEKFGNFSSNSA